VEDAKEEGIDNHAVVSFVEQAHFIINRLVFAISLYIGSVDLVLCFFLQFLAIVYLVYFN